MQSSDNSWVLITGASSGFGREFAQQYAAEGRSLILVARRLNELEMLAEELRARYAVDVLVQQADLSSIDVIIDLHRDLHDRNIVVDILINNAGYGLQGALWTPLWKAPGYDRLGYRQSDRHDPPLCRGYASTAKRTYFDGCQLVVLSGRQEFCRLLCSQGVCA